MLNMYMSCANGEGAMQLLASTLDFRLWFIAYQKDDTSTPIEGIGVYSHWFSFWHRCSRSISFVIDCSQTINCIILNF